MFKVYGTILGSRNSGPSTSFSTICASSIADALERGPEDPRQHSVASRPAIIGFPNRSGFRLTSELQQIIVPANLLFNTVRYFA
jgi:hypothetical protein